MIFLKFYQYIMLLNLNFTSSYFIVCHHPDFYKHLNTTQNRGNGFFIVVYSEASVHIGE